MLKVCLLLWKCLLILKIVPKATSEFLCRLPFSVIGGFSPVYTVHVIAGFWNHFQDHSRLSEKGRGFIGASRKNVQNVFFNYLHKKTAKNCESHLRSYKKYWVRFKDLKKIFISWHCPCKGDCEVMGGAALREWTGGGMWGGWGGGGKKGKPPMQ